MIQHRICAEIKRILLVKANWNLPGTINLFHWDLLRPPPPYICFKWLNGCSWSLRTSLFFDGYTAIRGHTSVLWIQDWVSSGRLEENGKLISSAEDLEESGLNGM